MPIYHTRLSSSDASPADDNWTMTFAPSAIPLFRTQLTDNRRKYACPNTPSVPRTAIPLMLPRTWYRGFAPHTTRGVNGIATNINLPSFWMVAWNDIGSVALISDSFMHTRYQTYQPGYTACGGITTSTVSPTAIDPTRSTQAVNPRRCLAALTKRDVSDASPYCVAITRPGPVHG
jgi:hypothetical protein